MFFVEMGILNFTNSTTRSWEIIRRLHAHDDSKSSLFLKLALAVWCVSMFYLMLF